MLILVCYTFQKKVDKNHFGLKAVYDGKLLAALLRLSVWSMMHAFISVAPWFLFFVAIERLGEVQLAASNITRSVSTVFFVIVNSFAATSGSLVSNLIGAGEGQNLFRLCSKVLRLGYAVGGPLIVIALLFNRQIVGFYTDNAQLIEFAHYPFIVMLLNYGFALPGYVYVNAVTGTGNTRMAFISLHNYHLPGLSLSVELLPYRFPVGLFNGRIPFCDIIGCTVLYLLETEARYFEQISKVIISERVVNASAE